MLSYRDFYLAAHASVHRWGGGLSAAGSLADALRQAGYRTLLIGLNERATNDVGDADAERLDLPSGMPGWQWRVRTWRLPRLLANSLRVLPRPRRGFVALSPDWVLAARATWPDLPVIYVFPCLLANCLPFTWDSRPGVSQWSAYLGTRRTEQRAFRLADLVLAPTPAAAAEIRAFAPAVGGRLKTVTYGVRHLRAPCDARQRLRAQLEISGDTLLCAVIGSCDRNKNFAAAVRALRDTHRTELVVIGDGPELTALRRVAQALDVDGRIAFVGSQSAMGEWYAAIDAVISTSFYDTFPNVVLEGLAAGKPVVVPRHDPPRTYSGTAALVEAAGAGLQYAGDDARALAAALRQLAADPTLRRRMGANGAAAVTRQCVWSRVAQRILTQCGCAVQAPLSSPAPREAPPAHAVTC